MVCSDFFSIHCHSEFSNLRMKDSINKIPDMLLKANKLGYKGLSLSDHESVSGHVRWTTEFEKLKSSGKLPEDFKVALGNEIYLVDNVDGYVDANNRSHYWHFLLTALDKTGFEMLKELSSSAWKHHKTVHNTERVPTLKSDVEKIIAKYGKGHIVGSTACLGSELSYYCLACSRNDNDSGMYKQCIHKFINWCINVFCRENFYLEIMPAHQESGDQYRYQGIVNEMLVRFAKAYGVQLIVTTDVHYLAVEDRAVHTAYLTSSSDGQERGRDTSVYYNAYMMPVDTISECLRKQGISDEDIAKAFQGTMNIYDRVESYSLAQDIIVPTDRNIKHDFLLQHILKQYYDACEYIKDFASSEYEQDRYLLYLIEQGILDKQIILDKDIAERIDIELKQLWLISDKLGTRLSSYYILVRNIINEVVWKHSYVGVARGSVTGFYICYLINITQLNPLKYDLPFWRHLESNRP